jgi:hypothetical protein
MNWTTLYIQGKSGFGPEVLKNLEQSEFDFLKGYLLESGVCLYWVDEKANLRDFKTAIGAKTIFKYRLQFYSTIEEMVESQPDLTGNSLPNLKAYA